MDKDNDSGAPAAAPPSTVRQTISISLSKKPKKKVTSAKLQLSTPEEEYSTIAEHADALSRKRAEEGEVLVIPCQQTRDEGKPLLAQRSRTQDVSNEVATTTIDLLQKDDDDEATRQLIESATHRQDDEAKQSSGLTIEAPRKNTLNTKAATSTATDDELFRRDLSNRAEDVDPTSSTYANISIKDFGGALLRGMGWEGGDNKKKEDEVKARPHRLGLGATPLLPPPTGKHGRARRPEELKREEERMKAEEDRERKRLEMEKLDVQYTLQIGSVVKIDGGRAKVIQTAGVPGLNRILVRMESGQEEAVSKGIVRLCSWDELEKYPFQEKRERHEERRGNDVRCNEKSRSSPSNNAKTNGHGRDEFSDDDRDRRRHKDSSRYRSDENRHHEAKRKASSRDKYYSSDDDSRSKKRRKESRRGKYDSSDEERRHKRKKKESRFSGKRDRNEEERRSPKHRDRGERKRNKCTDSQEHINWLLPNIRIRIVSKKYCQHLQKGIVQDVISSQNNNSKAVILLDNQEVLDNVPERYLETALPKTGGNVILLEGVHRWKKGRLLERSSETGRGVIQLFDDLEVVEVSLDGVAEWCGPLDEDLE